MKLSEYLALDGIAIAEGIKAQMWSAIDVVECARQVIEALNPELNAVVMKNYEIAAGVAKRQLPDTRLAGVPLLLKDVNVSTSDMPTTFSCRFFQDAKPAHDSAIVRRWREAGLAIIGKTNTPEFAEDFVCEPTWRGPTLNPWDDKITTGGSSGGAGAAVASGMVPIAHGTDLGGSIRIPAACCGVYGFKPTTGLNPVDFSHQELASGFNSDHVLTRTVRDSAAVLDVTAHPLTGSRYSVHRQVPSFLDTLHHYPENLRIGVCTHTPTGEQTPARQQQAVEKVSLLLESAGHRVVAYRFPKNLNLGYWLDTLWMFDIIAELEAGAQQRGRQPEDYELEALTRYMREYVKRLSAMDHHYARVAAHRQSVILMDSLSDFDLLLTPSLGSDPIPLGSMDSRTDSFNYQNWSDQGLAFAPFSYFCNVTGQPSASLPVWFPGDTFPGAVQLSGHNGSDHVVLQMSAYLEQHLDWGARLPCPV